MKGMKISIIIAIVLIILFLMMGPFFILEEGEQAVVTRFGKIVSTSDEAGLKFKMPMVDTVMKYPKKIQSWDGDAQRLPTEENQFILVDVTARWKIIDSKLFYESVGTIPQAHSRLDDIINSRVRMIVARNSLRESVRTSNVINEIERKDVYKTPQGEQDEKDKAIADITTFTKTVYPVILKGRNKLSDAMLEEARKNTSAFGIELIDIVTRQIKYSRDLTVSVYNRMIKERSQIAQAFRSQGEGEKAEWRGKMERELLTIQSDAVRQAKEIKAKADATALEIRNKSYSKDAEFAEFWIALTQYQNLLPKMKKILTTDIEFFDYLYKKTKR
ncbi:MAG: protease modulator HflC [Candidatus Aminicenantes bacterium]|nr:protease modulator HflC [Candidatus Aminicenantes bacterium]